MVCVSPSAWNIDPDDDEIVDELEEGAWWLLTLLSCLWVFGKTMENNSLKLIRCKTTTIFRRQIDI